MLLSRGQRSETLSLKCSAGVVLRSLSNNPQEVWRSVLNKTAEKNIRRVVSESKQENTIKQPKLSKQISLLFHIKLYFFSTRINLQFCCVQQLWECLVQRRAMMWSDSRTQNNKPADKINQMCLRFRLKVKTRTRNIPWIQFNQSLLNLYVVRSNKRSGFLF